MMGLAVDLVIWNEDRSGYRQELQDEIMGLVSISTDTGAKERSGGVFVIHADQISEEAGVLVQAVAKAIFTDDRGTFEDQLERTCKFSVAVPLLTCGRGEGRARSPRSLGRG